jgi:hypothetical protein
MPMVAMVAIDLLDMAVLGLTLARPGIPRRPSSANDVNRLNPNPR